MTKRNVAVTLAIATTIAAGVADARDREKSPADVAVVAQLAACRAISEDTARLACFDREAARFDDAVRNHKVAVIDQEEVRKTRRTLFGIALPEIKLFSSDDKEPELREITATIKSKSQGEGGRIVFTLDDGATWAQTDDYPVYYSVKAGQKVTIKRAALGSYFADFEKTVTVRAKRVR